MEAPEKRDKEWKKKLDHYIHRRLYRNHLGLRIRQKQHPEKNERGKKGRDSGSAKGIPHNVAISKRTELSKEFL